MTTTLYSMAQDLLARVLQCFTQLGATPPARQLVYMSPIPADCEQLAVLFSGWIPEPPLDGLIKCGVVRWSGQFSVVVVRPTCALPDKRGSAPTVELMQQAAQLASDDAEVLLCLAGTLTEAGTLEVVTGAPNGGYQTVGLDIIIPAVGGY